MKRLHFVGDGERDRHTVPHLVRSLLADQLGRPVHFDERFAPWARLSGGGYGRKLSFAARQADDDRAQGLVAVVDRDRARKGERLRAVQRGRDDERARRPLPIAVGEADPHGEAWLLADMEAVRTACSALQQVPIDENARSPKAEIDRLWKLLGTAGARPDRSEFLAHIAGACRPSIVAAAVENGFAAFADQVRAELLPALR